MKQRKQARKKPKDPGAVPAKGDPEGRGGAVARAPLPGYMRATSCSDAKAATAAPPRVHCPGPAVRVDKHGGSRHARRRRVR